MRQRQKERQRQQDRKTIGYQDRRQDRKTDRNSERQTETERRNRDFVAKMIKKNHLFITIRKKDRKKAGKK